VARVGKTCCLVRTDDESTIGAYSRYVGADLVDLVHEEPAERRHQLLAVFVVMDCLASSCAADSVPCAKLETDRKQFFFGFGRSRKWRRN